MREVYFNLKDAFFYFNLGDIEREKKQYQQYIARTEDWKSLKLTLAIEDHKYDRSMLRFSVCYYTNPNNHLATYEHAVLLVV